MRKWSVIMAFVVSLGFSALSANTNTWQFDPNHTSAHFTVRHLGISNIQGSFAKVTGSVDLDDQDISKSSVNASIDVSSVYTGVEARDKDLRSDHYFDVAKYPTMTFQSTRISKASDGSLKMTGNLTLHGVTKEIRFDVDGPSAPITEMGATHRGATATAKITRQDFGITGGGTTIGDQVMIVLDIDMVHK